MHWFLSLPLNLRLAMLFVAGLLLGALVNLGIYRLAYFRRRISPWSRTRGQVPPRSWTDRLPVIGWWRLRRESTTWGRGFWLRPLLIEIGFGLSLVGLYCWEIFERALVNPPLEPRLLATLPAALIVQMHWTYFIHAALLMLMALAVFIDLDEMTIPDTITVPGTILGLFLAAFCSASFLPGWFDALPGGIQNPTTGPAIIQHPLTFDYPDTAAAFISSPLSLFIGLCIYLLWCFALLPRYWRWSLVRAGKCALMCRAMGRIIFKRPEWRWVLPLAVAGSVGIFLAWHSGGAVWRGLMTALVGLAVGGGMIWAIRIIGTAVLQREAMGFGDVTLMAMLGTFLGWQPVLLVFFISPIAGALLGMVGWMFHRKDMLPYGPFLCLGALIIILWWAPIWSHVGQYFEVPWLVPSAMLICLPLLGVLLYGWMRIKMRFLIDEEEA